LRSSEILWHQLGTKGLREAETVTLFDVIARLLSVSLQYGAFSPLEKMGDLLSGGKSPHADPSPDMIASSIAGVCWVKR
jgi:hypothetical protein